MFCYVKYIEYKKFQELSNYNSTDLKPLGDIGCKKLVVNPNCPLQIILDYIFEEVGLDENAKNVIDLSTEKGKRCKIKTFAPLTNGLEVLKPHATYYIVFPEVESGSFKSMTPMLNKFSSEYTDFLKTHRRNTRRLTGTSTASRNTRSSARSSIGTGSLLRTRSRTSKLSA